MQICTLCLIVSNRFDEGFGSCINNYCFFCFLFFLDSICLLLKASEYSRADELAEKWLSCEENFHHHKYLKITELYVKHVLLPQGFHRKIDNFLEGNEALTFEQKQVRACVLSFLQEKNNYIIIAAVCFGKRSCFETQTPFLCIPCMPEVIFC